MKFLLLALIGLVGVVSAFELQFAQVNGAAGSFLRLGTPFQGPFRVGVHIQESTTLKMGLDAYGGDYDASAGATSSWKYICPDGTAGWFGTEAFQLGMQVMTDIPFEVTKNTSMSKPPQYFGLGPYENDTFLGGVMDTQDDKTISIAYSDYPNVGILTIGGVDSQRCANWQTMPEVFYTNPLGKQTWGTNLTEVSIGSYTATSAPLLSFNLDNNAPIRWPSLIYYSVLEELGTGDGTTVACQQTKNIDFKVGSVEFSLKPEEYLVEYAGACTLAGVPMFTSIKEITMPTKFLKHACISFNHETQIVGVGDLQ